MKISYIILIIFFTYSIIESRSQNLSVSQQLFSRNHNLLAFQNDTITNSFNKELIWKPFDTRTILIQTGMGTLATLLMASFAYSLLGSDPESVSLAYFGIFFSPILIWVIPTAMYYGGEMTGGNGSFWWTLAGEIVLGGVAILPNILRGSGEKTATVITAGIGVFLGCILGYHLSAEPVYKSTGASSGLERIEKFTGSNIQPWRLGFPQNIVQINLVSIRF